MNYNSTINQRILGKLVERDVIMLASGLVEDLLEVGKLSHDDIENALDYQCINEDCNDAVLEGNDSDGYQCPNCGCTTHAPEEDGMVGEVKDIYEWYFVTEWLYDKLKAKGEAVMDSDYGYLWGRCTTGQAILLDYVIGQIGEDLEILESQRYSWEDHE